MIVVVYIISGIGAIALSSFCMALVLWLNLEDASFDDLKDNLKLCVVYNVIINLVSLAVLGLHAVSPVLALIPAIAGIVISFKLLMNWFELSFFRSDLCPSRDECNPFGNCQQLGRPSHSTNVLNPGKPAGRLQPTLDDSPHNKYPLVMELVCQPLILRLG